MSNRKRIHEALSTLHIVEVIKKIYPNDIQAQRERAYKELAGEINIANSETRDVFREVVHDIFR